MTTNPYDPFTEAELHEAYARATGLPSADDEYEAELDEEAAARLAEVVAAERHARAVAEVTERLRARADAEKLIQAGARPPMPRLERLDELLARPIEPVRYLVDRLWPRGGRVVLSAQAKSGKTTMRDNLIRSLVDGQRFLDKFSVGDLQGNVALVDAELAEDTMSRWLSDQGIREVESVYTVSLRGRTTTFDLLDDGRRQEWSSLFKQANVGVLIIDCLGPILAAAGLDESKGIDVGRWLNALESLVAEAGITEMLIVHHMGHLGERSRGASRLRDWPDAEWRLLRSHDLEGGDEDGPPDVERYFAAAGRDVEESEAQLHYDPVSRHLSMTNGERVSRRSAKAKRDVPAVIAYVREHPGLSGRNLEAALIEVGLGRNRARDAIRAAVRQSDVHTHPGPRSSQLHYPKYDCAICATTAPPEGAHLPGCSCDECASAPPLF